MTWPDVFVLCFFVGFLFSLISGLSGHINLHFHHGGLHVHHGGTVHGGQAPAHGSAGKGSVHPAGPTHVPIVNVGTLAAFLTWFGGAGYLATRYYGALWLSALLVAIGFGVF